MEYSFNMRENHQWTVGYALEKCAINSKQLKGKHPITLYNIKIM